MGAPREVAELAERFDRNVEAYRAGRINEENTKVSYINPLLEALGWDVRNAQGRPGGYQDVVFEDSVKIGGGTKAPDYGFYVGGARKFFLEAKKPSVNLADDVNPAVQLRRYAWTARHPVGILTDFEELAVYDCRVEPGKDDQPATARALYLRYDEYEDRWDELAELFGRDAVSAGSLERFAETAKSRRGTETVDRAFLREIEGWRQTLAKDLARRNAVNGRQLNYAVQTTIDRIIFLRMAEDRGIEEYGRLLALTNGPNVYGRMLGLFREADDRYNSGLFHFRSERGRLEEPDDLTPHLSIDDAALSGIIRGLYYPECPYEFSVLPVDVLGQVYEQFLGSVIRLDSPDSAVVEAKPEVRKAGGVYYTPTYIVDYIVGNTLGKLLEGKRPGPRGGASRLKIVDPACGSGSFLIGAYEYLLDWHRDRYVEDGPDKHHKRLYEGPGGQWHLTIEEKKRILVNNVHGVDIDPQAVEVTKLSLLLKVLEGETDESITRQLSLFAAERALPDLDANIKCGNSLIGPDFYDQPQMSLLEEEEHYRINVFDWEKSFPQVFTGDDPGFDAVFGNPPYIRIQSLKEFAPVEAEHYKGVYLTAAKGNYDIYVTFIEKGLGLLNGSGRLGYIVPHKFFNAKYGAPVRGMISSGGHLSEIVHFGDEQVFTGATTYTALVFLDAAANNDFRFVKADDLTAWRTEGEADESTVLAEAATPDEWSFVAGRGAGLFERLRWMPVKLGQIATGMFVGQQTSADTVYLFKDFQHEEHSGLTKVFSKSLGEWITLEPEILKPVIRSGSIDRYEAETTAFVLFPYMVEDRSAELYTESEMKASFPLAWEYLDRNRQILEEREKGKFKDSQWYRFGRTQNLGMWEQQKMMIPYMITRLAAYPDRSGNYYFINVTTGGYGVTVDESMGSLDYLTALINSRLLDFYLKQVSTNFNSGYFAANKQYIEQLPIRTIDFSDAEDAERHERMVGLVERMLGLHERLAEARIERERTVVGHQISATDRQIDALVYELYGLTEDEIAIVEEAMGR